MNQFDHMRHEPKPGVAFFMPAHNEADNLPVVVAKASQHFRLTGRPFTIIIVDDGSTDGTAEVLVDLRMQHGINIVSHTINAGYGAALRSGIQAAYDAEREYIAFCDADGQFDPADIDLLIEAIDAEPHYGAALGVRHARADGLQRRLTGRVWHWLSRSVLDFDAQDVDCGFKLFKQEVIEAIGPASLLGNHAVISPEILARIKLEGYKVTDVPVPHYNRQYGQQSGMKLSVMLGSLFGLFKVRRSIRREVRGVGDNFGSGDSAEGNAA